MNAELQEYVDRHEVAKLLNDIAVDLLVWKAADPMDKIIQFLEKRLRKQGSSQPEESVAVTTHTEGENVTEDATQAAEPSTSEAEPLTEAPQVEKAERPTTPTYMPLEGGIHDDVPKDAAEEVDPNPIVYILSQLDTREAGVLRIDTSETLSKTSNEIRKVLQESQAVATRIARLQAEFDSV